MASRRCAFIPIRGPFPWWSRTSLLAKCLSRRANGSTARTVCLVDSLGEAIQRGYVQDFGVQISLNSDGFLRDNDLLLSSKHQVSVFKDVITAIRKALKHLTVEAIFVRGSAITGNLFADSRSDIDIIIFTDKSVSKGDKRQLRRGLSVILGNTFQVQRADTRFVHRNRRRGSKEQFRLSPALQITLRYFAVPIFGSRETIGLSDGPIRPRPYQAIDIRNDINKLRRALEAPDAEDYLVMKLAAIQWLCKRCLRATAELCALRTGAYARDLLPCYRLGSKAYPKYARKMLQALLISCASPENRYLDMRKNEIIRTGTDIAFQFSEIVEELAIRECFGSNLETSNAPAVVSKDVVSSAGGSFDTFNQLKEALFTWRLLFRERVITDSCRFRTRSLPELELEGSRSVEVRPVKLGIETTGRPNFKALFAGVFQPLVYRDTSHTLVDSVKVTGHAIECLQQAVSSVQCRVAPEFDVTFCRASHPWIDNLMFRPLSVLVSLPVREAIQRLQERHEQPNLVYDDGDEECVYIQTRAIPSLRVFDLSRTQNWDVVQEERLWISSHGTVSTLHYDASYSALYQRCGQKRLIFFPPSCLPQLGIYPLGHPLHRRGRVDLTRKDTVIFQEFWEQCPSKAIEVTLQPGDLLVFPPFWAHYTESITNSNKSLSISHTLRYVSRERDN